MHRNEAFESHDGGRAKLDPSEAHPIRMVLRNLQLFSTEVSGTPSPDSTEVDLLLRTAEAADTIARCLHLGTGAIGQLMAYAAPELEDGTVSSDSVEALGWLLSLLGELGGEMAVLALNCGRAAGRAQ